MEQSWWWGVGGSGGVGGGVGGGGRMLEGLWGCWRGWGGCWGGWGVGVVDVAKTVPGSRKVRSTSWGNTRHPATIGRENNHVDTHNNLTIPKSFTGSKIYKKILIRKRDRVSQLPERSYSNSYKHLYTSSKSSTPQIFNKP